MRCVVSASEPAAPASHHPYHPILPLPSCHRILSALVVTSLDLPIEWRGVESEDPTLAQAPQDLPQSFLPTEVDDLTSSSMIGYVICDMCCVVCEL
jgi:hypothetical protein